MATNNAINASMPMLVSRGGTGLSTMTANAVLIGNGTSAVQSVGPLTNGQVLIGSTGGLPVAASLTAGSGISITGGSGSLTIASTATGMTVNEVTSTSSTMVANSINIPNNVSLVTLTLPSTCAQGAMIYLVGKGAGKWLVAQNAGQQINFGSSSSTPGTGGSINATLQFDCGILLCTTANTQFQFFGTQGDINVT